MEVNQELCIGCESCVAICPVGAAQVKEGKVTINQEKCLCCGACIGDCPMGAVSFCR